MNYYIGIDGGGTKTQYALFDENKNMISTVKTAGTNHENLDGGIPAAAKILMGGINELLLCNAMLQENVTFVLMALAGMDHPYQEEALTEALKDLGLKIPFSVCNDGFIIVKAGSKHRAAIGYNCGTGTCCDSIDDNGRLLQVGGFGDLSGDTGGGLWIAAEVFRMAFDDICLGVRPTLCTKLLSRKLGVRADREGLLSLVPRLEEAHDPTVRDLIDVYFDAINADDPAALASMEKMAQRGAEYINAHFVNGSFSAETVDVVLSGSIHIKLPSDRYIALLAEKAQALTGRKLNFIKLTVPPVTGCINWMLEEKA